MDRLALALGQRVPVQGRIELEPANPKPAKTPPERMQAVCPSR